MIQWGINALNHGHSIAVFQDGKFINNFIGTGDDLHSQTTVPALGHGSPNRLFWYERPWIKKARQLYAGQYRTAFDLSVLPRKNTRQFYYAPITYTPHHASHAAAGYYTSPFNHCAIVVLDAIGEFECATIWEGLHGEMRKVWSRSYPHSLGLFYSAFTKLIGLTPIKDEFLLQQMAEQGDPTRFRRQVAKYFGPNTLRLEYNFHRGVLNWPSEPVNLLEQCDIAAAVQERFETEIGSIMRLAANLTNADSLVYMGGCAMNSRANQREVEPVFKYRWSLPNPGDPSSSIGAVLYHTRQRVWDYRWDPVKHLAINI